MTEKSQVMILCSILFILALASNYFYFYNSSFNFYKSELEINGNQITEKLYYSPDKDYHTLFRNFADSIYVNSEGGNSVTILNIVCSDGTPYTYAQDGFFIFKNTALRDSPMPYTESNEYGCSFGGEYGFFPKNQYWISSSYTLNPQNIFVVNGKQYIKFVAYSPDMHVTFFAGKNLFISGDAKYDSVYGAKDNVVIYIPYSGNAEGKTLIYLKSFDYDSSYLKYFMMLLFCLIPAISLFLVWRFFGKENQEPSVPSSLSQNPSDRKAWEVAAYFNPPFSQPGKNFVSSLILDLYNRKIIDIKVEDKFLGKKCLIKILKEDGDFDEIEKRFLDIVEYIRDNAKEKYLVNGFVDISSGNSYFLRKEVNIKFKGMSKAVEKNGKQYLDKKGFIIFLGINVVMLIACFYAFQDPIPAIPAFAGLFLGFIFGTYSSLLIRYNKDYYKEYLEWQAFKDSLNHAPSLKLHGYKGVVLWQKYLLYAAALGVSAKVIEELKNQGLISDKQYVAYVSTSRVSVALAATGASSGSHGGAGGGGVGGGGGGGR